MSGVSMEPEVKPPQLLFVQAVDAADVEGVEYEPAQFFVVFRRMGKA